MTNFLPKCRAQNVDSEKGHGAGKKGMALVKRAWRWRKGAWRGAIVKVARRNITPRLFCNMVRYSTVLDITQTMNGLILLYIYIFYSRYNTNWIANTEIVLDPNNNVIKRLRCSK